MKVFLELLGKLMSQGSHLQLDEKSTKLSEDVIQLIRERGAIREEPPQIRQNAR